ncbi:MAG TPA: methyltransferase domain-containing protein [Devosia sp.]|jgi:SAM-dependent methyltransferase|nr:methyltransferase domain-containing protein [Devosia sp.]
MVAIDFSRRSDMPELMDTEECDFETFRGCLVDLSWVNRMSFGYRPTLSFLDDAARSGLLPIDRPLRIVDVGSGYGDMLRQVFAWSRRRGIAVSMTGVDLNPWSAKAASEATPAGVPVEWRTGDVFEEVFEDPVDLVISSLFTHHLDDEALVRFLSWMEHVASVGWFVNDLHRHELPYRFFTLASRAMRMHRFVQHDGPVSFARSFERQDWLRLLAAAGVPADAASLRWWMPYRLCVERLRAG